jgi:hypothetical protein
MSRRRAIFLAIVAVVALVLLNVNVAPAYEKSFERLSEQVGA